GEPGPSTPRDLPPPRAAARAVLAGAGPSPERGVAGDRPPDRRAAQPPRRGRVRHRGRRPPDRAARRGPRARWAIALARPAARAPPPQARAPHARRPDRPDPAAARRSGGAGG